MYCNQPMIQRRHHRHNQYSRTRSTTAVKIRKLVALVMLVMLVLYAGKKTLNFFGVGNSIRKTAVLLSIEASGIVNVSVDGGPLKRAETDLKLYAGDAVVSSPRNHATLDFFDGSSLRVDESTQIEIEKSEQGEQHSVLEVTLEEGTVWIATPTLKTYSGSITRTVQSAFLKALLPSTAEVVFAPRSISVFSADGLGLEVAVAGTDRTVIIGEGQQFTVPLGSEFDQDLYTYRNPLDPQQLASTFVEKSRAVHSNTQLPGDIVTTGDPKTEVDDFALSIDKPEDGITITTGTVEVAGRIGRNVDRVRINGYLATINKESGTFSQELALADEDEVRIIIEAVDETGVVVGETLRTVLRDRKPPEPPAFTRPAASGQTYRTNNSEIEIAGTAPAGVVGILVNDYRLQLFKPGDTSWSYLASTKLNNFHAGENIYEITAISAGGYRSEQAVLTIILGEGEEGIVPEEEELIHLALPVEWNHSVGADSQFFPNY